VALVRLDREVHFQRELLADMQRALNYISALLATALT